MCFSLQRTKLTAKRPQTSPRPALSSLSTTGIILCFVKARQNYLDRNPPLSRFCDILKYGISSEIFLCYFLKEAHSLGFMGISGLPDATETL